MKYIAPIAVIAIIALQMSGAVPKSSVGGPLTLALVFFAAMLAVGIHEAWSRKRGVLGWLVNIPVTFVGGILGNQLGGLVLVVMLMLASPFVSMNVSLVATGGPILYVSLAAIMVFSLLGSWGALWIVNRWR